MFIDKVIIWFLLLHWTEEYFFDFRMVGVPLSKLGGRAGQLLIFKFWSSGPFCSFSRTRVCEISQRANKAPVVDLYFSENRSYRE